MGNLRLSPGSLVANRFEIKCTAGSGGMGTVYRATDRYSGDTVALKLLRADRDVGGSQESERFAREAQLLSELRHSAIVSHIAHGQAQDGQRFLAMEWLEGQDLSERLARGPLPIRDCLRLLDQVAEALSVAHRRGIIHRDLKPSNLFLVGGDIGRVKILDFGIARRIATSHVMTKTGLVIGTPEYMAPEQARGSRDLRPAADIFSIGCVLYECLTGRPPFVADHIAAVLVRILFEEPIPIEQCRPSVPASLSAFLERLLKKDPTQRVADAAELRAELLSLGELPEPALAVTAVVPKPQAETFAEQEQSLFSVVLAAPAEEEIEIGLDATQPGSAVHLRTTERQALLQALAALGGSPDFLANGTLVITVPLLGSAQDQATLAARSALIIKERWPDAVVSMATGRGAVRGRTAVGEVVELAVRSLRSGSQAVIGKPVAGVLLDLLSAKLLADRFAVTPHPGGALLIHEQRDMDASRPLLGKPTPCVGREVELGNLEAQLAACVEESEARVVLFTAAPGVGKSRLRHEFLRRVEKRGQPVTVLLGRGDMMSAGTPYGILRVALHGLCGISGSEAFYTQRERLRIRVAQNLAAEHAERVVLFVGELCNVPFPEEGKPVLQSARRDPKSMRDCLRHALVDFLAAECAAAPVLVILDDLQWSDELTVSALDEVLRELASSPLFVLSFARPEVHEVFPKLWPSHRVQEIPLKGLSKKACERLVGHCLGKEVSAEAVARAVEHSAGNALFLEELIRSVAEGNFEQQPETVVAMLQVRLSKLDGSLRRAVRAASVFGQTFWHGGIAALLAAPVSEVDNWLEALVDAELIQPHMRSRLGGQTEYGFRHALVRDAAYGLLTDSDLRAGHLQAAEFLASTKEAVSASIAEHFERGGDRQRAASYYLRAAQENLRTGNYLGTLHWVDQGLLCSPEEALRVQLCSIEPYAAIVAGRYDRIAASAEYAIERLRPGSLAWCRVIAGALFATGSSQNASRGSEVLSQILATEPDEDACSTFVESLHMIVLTLVPSVPGFLLQAIIDKLADTVFRAELKNPLIRRYLHSARGLVGWYREPRPWTAILEYQQAIRLAREANDQILEQSVRITPVERVWLELGDFEQGRYRLLASEKEVASTEIDILRVAWRLLLADMLCQLRNESDWTQAEELVSPILLAGHRAYPSLAKSVLAQVALLRGQLAQAEAQAAEVMQSFPADWVQRIHAASLQIHALIGLGRPSGATAAAEKVLATFPIFGGAGYAEVEFRVAASVAFHSAGNLDRAHIEMRETLRQVQLRADDITDPFWKNSYLTRNRHCVQAQALAKEWGLDIVVK